LGGQTGRGKKLKKKNGKSQKKGPHRRNKKGGGLFKLAGGREKNLGNRQKQSWGDARKVATNANGLKERGKKKRVVEPGKKKTRVKSTLCDSTPKKEDSDGRKKEERGIWGRRGTNSEQRVDQSAKGRARKGGAEKSIKVKNL